MKYFENFNGLDVFSTLIENHKESLCGKRPEYSDEMKEAKIDERLFKFRRYCIKACEAIIGAKKEMYRILDLGSTQGEQELALFLEEINSYIKDCKFEYVEKSEEISEELKKSLDELCDDYKKSNEKLKENERETSGD